jgi:hypothetical protein
VIGDYPKEEMPSHVTGARSAHRATSSAIQGEPLANRTIIDNICRFVPMVACKVLILLVHRDSVSDCALPAMRTKIRKEFIRLPLGVNIAEHSSLMAKDLLANSSPAAPILISFSFVMGKLTASEVFTSQSLNANNGVVSST